MSWNTHKLGELIETKKGYAFKSSWYQNYGHPIVKVSDFTDDSIDTSSLANIPQEIADEYSSYKLCERDVIIQTVGSWPSNPASVVGKCINVPLAAHGALLNQNAVKISPKDRLDNIFLYYLLRSPAFKNYIINTARGSASQASITLDAIRKFEITIPSAESQKHIGFVLKCYDDLIENNRRRIQLLEESARLLYKEWFVQLRFPGHEHVKIVDGVPEGWSREPLGDLLTLQRGFDLPAKNRKDGLVPIYASTGVNGFHSEAKVKGPGVVTGRSGSLGTVMYVAKDHWPLNTTLWVKEFKKITPIISTFILRALKLENYNGGAAVPTLNRNDAHKIEVLCPSDTLIREFDIQVATIFSQIDKLTEYSLKLSQARDILLPRLMNGTLTV